MKKIFQFTLGVAALATMFITQSCNQVTNAVKLPDYSWTGASYDITFPPTNDTTAQATIGTQDMTVNIDQLIKDNTGGVGSFNSIKSVHITDIKLTLLDATTQNNFANFSYAGAAFNTDANNGNYDPYNIAYVENNPDVYSTILTPPVLSTNDDVKKYFQSNTKFYYIVVAKLRRPLKDSVHCHVDLTYNISF